MLSERVRKVAPFDGGAWFGMDPKTILPSAPVRVESTRTAGQQVVWVLHTEPGTGDVKPGMLRRLRAAR